MQLPSRIKNAFRAISPKRPRRKIPAVPICVTTLLNDPKGPAWTLSHLKAASWVAVVQTPYFSDDNVLRRAIKIYDTMEAGRAYCPVVTTYQGSIKIEYEHEGRVDVFLLDPGQTRWGSGERGKPYPIVSVDLSSTILEDLARWVAKGETE